MSKGYIKLWRKIQDWEWWDDINTFRLFMVLLMHANIEDKKWHGITVPRGSFVTSRDNLSKMSGLSIQAVRTSLTKLKSTSEITSKTTNKFTLIKLNNWDEYQSSNQQNNQQTTTTKEYKNIKEYNMMDEISENKNIELDHGPEPIQEYLGRSKMLLAMKNKRTISSMTVSEESHVVISKED